MTNYQELRLEDTPNLLVEVVAASVGLIPALRNRIDNIPDVGDKCIGVGYLWVVEDAQGYHITKMREATATESAESQRGIVWDTLAKFTTAQRELAVAAFIGFISRYKAPNLPRPDASDLQRRLSEHARLLKEMQEQAAGLLRYISTLDSAGDFND